MIARVSCISATIPPPPSSLCTQYTHTYSTPQSQVTQQKIDFSKNVPFLSLYFPVYTQQSKLDTHKYTIITAVYFSLCCDVFIYIVLFSSPFTRLPSPYFFFLISKALKIPAPEKKICDVKPGKKVFSS